jgi:hypothetical protein
MTMYVIRERMFRLGEDSDITDEAGSRWQADGVWPATGSSADQPGAKSGSTASRPPPPRLRDHR